LKWARGKRKSASRVFCVRPEPSAEALAIFEMFPSVSGAQPLEMAAEQEAVHAREVWAKPLLASMPLLSQYSHRIQMNTALATLCSFAWPPSLSLGQ